MPTFAGDSLFLPSPRPRCHAFQLIASARDSLSQRFITAFMRSAVLAHTPHWTDREPREGRRCSCFNCGSVPSPMPGTKQVFNRCLWVKEEMHEQTNKWATPPACHSQE